MLHVFASTDDCKYLEQTPAEEELFAFQSVNPFCVQKLWGVPQCPPWEFRLQPESAEIVGVLDGHRGPNLPDKKLRKLPPQAALLTSRAVAVNL